MKRSPATSLLLLALPASLPASPGRRQALIANRLHVTGWVPRR